MNTPWDGCLKNTHNSIFGTKLCLKLHLHQTNPFQHAKKIVHLNEGQIDMKPGKVKPLFSASLGEKNYFWRSLGSTCEDSLGSMC